MTAQTHANCKCNPCKCGPNCACGQKPACACGQTGCPCGCGGN